MAGIQSLGIGSGMDVNSIVSQLMEIEQRPLIDLGQKEAQYHAEISAYGTLKSAVSSLQSSIDALKNTATFQAMSASTSDSAVLTVAADTDATSSSYDVTVNRLAQRHKTGSSAFASATTFGGGAGDALTITVGTDSFTVDLSTAKTLAEIQAAINVSANDTDVTAGIITGDSANQTLVLTAQDSGYDNRVQLSYGGAINSATFNFATLNRDPDGVLLAADTELDASLTVDGVSVTRASNSITDVVEGLTLTLKAEGSATASISQNTSVATGAVDAFVKAYNTLKSQMTELSSGALRKSSLSKTIESQIRGVLNQAISGLGAYSYIQEMGVTTTETGKLQIDSSKLSAALASDLDSVSAFFTDASAGFAVQLDSIFDDFLEAGGVFDDIVDGVNNRISGISRDRLRLEYRLEATERRLVEQFSALDTLISQMSTTSNYLTAQLANLPNLFGNKS